ncbi:MAG: hypothetical protein GY874_13845 [Desulfobacteraceae bacterium]|nr:hypothetical protein [Desulfobacteraceae bacterium]
MWPGIDKIIDLLPKLSKSFFVTICLIAAAFLFFPQNILNKLSLLEFKEKYGLYIGITFLCISVYLVVDGLFHIGKKICDKIDWRKKNNEIIKILQNLDPFEQGILREFYLQDKNTITLVIGKDSVEGLCNRGILERLSYTDKTGIFANMKISDFVIKHLTKELLGFPKIKPTQEEIKFLCDNRPRVTCIPNLSAHQIKTRACPEKLK